MTKQDIYVCSVCFECFDAPLVHCVNCGHHYPQEQEACSNCHMPLAYEREQITDGIALAHPDEVPEPARTLYRFLLGTVEYEQVLEAYADWLENTNGSSEASVEARRLGRELRGQIGKPFFPAETAAEFSAVLCNHMLLTLVQTNMPDTGSAGCPAPRPCLSAGAFPSTGGPL